MLLEAIWDGVSRDGPVSVLFSWRDYTIDVQSFLKRASEWENIHGAWAWCMQFRGRSTDERNFDVGRHRGQSPSVIEYHNLLGGCDTRLHLDFDPIGCDRKINPSKRSEICVCDVTELWEWGFQTIRPYSRFVGRSLLYWALKKIPLRLWWFMDHAHYSRPAVHVVNTLISALHCCWLTRVTLQRSKTKG